MVPGLTAEGSPNPEITSDPFALGLLPASGANGNGHTHTATSSGTPGVTQPKPMSKEGKPAQIVAKKPKEVPPGYQRTPHGIVPIPGYKDPAKLALEIEEERRGKGIGEALQGPAALAAAKKKKEENTGDVVASGIAVEEANKSSSSDARPAPQRKVAPSRPRQSSAAGRLPQLPNTGASGNGESKSGTSGSSNSSNISVGTVSPHAGFRQGPVEGVFESTSTPNSAAEDIFGAPPAGQKTVVIPDASSSLRRPTQDIGDNGKLSSGATKLTDVPLDGQSPQAPPVVASIKSPFDGAAGGRMLKPDKARLCKKPHAVTAFGFGGDL